MKLKELVERVEMQCTIRISIYDYEDQRNILYKRADDTVLTEYGGYYIRYMYVQDNELVVELRGEEE